MAAKYSKTTAAAEVDALVATTTTELGKLRQILLAADPAHADLQRHMSVMMLYSLWERASTTALTICLRLVRGKYDLAEKAPAEIAALWLRKSVFYQSMMSKISSRVHADDARRDAKNAYGTARELIAGVLAWLKAPLDHAIDPEKLIVTFSNVNKDVLRMNDELFGLQTLPLYGKVVDLSRLDDLVGKRNQVGHGGYLSSFGKNQSDEIVDYTEALIKAYLRVVKHWIKKLKTR